MADILIVGLLLIIILMITAVHAPEVLFYLVFGICIITLIVCVVVGAIMFVHDPWGFVSSLLLHNPISEFSNAVISATPTPNIFYMHKVI